MYGRERIISSQRSIRVGVVTRGEDVVFVKAKGRLTFRGDVVSPDNRTTSIGQIISGTPYIHKKEETLKNSQLSKEFRAIFIALISKKEEGHR